MNAEHYPISINYEYTNNSYKAHKWLNDLPNIFAADFETASKITLAEKEILKWTCNDVNLSKSKRVKIEQLLKSNGKSHPSLSVITHLSVAWTDRDAFVIVCDTNKIRSLVYNFLVSTYSTQLWHNCQFDFKHIYYNTGKLPQKYIDTMLLTKSLINNANNIKALVGLKQLMGYKYGAWKLVKEEDEDNFVLENMWDETMIKYSAIDSCATYSLYQDIQNKLNEWKI